MINAIAFYVGNKINLREVRNRIAENLCIFETPPLAWKGCELSEVDTKLNEELDLRTGLRAYSTVWIL
jgi:hypothetical protein